MKIYVLVESRAEGSDVPEIPDIKVFRTEVETLNFLKEDYDLSVTAVPNVNEVMEWTEDESGVWQDVEDMDDEELYEKRLTLQSFDI